MAGTQDAALPQVAARSTSADRRRAPPSPGSWTTASCTVGVEGLADAAQRSRPSRSRTPTSWLPDGLHAVDAVGERRVEGVEHGEQLVDQAPRRPARPARPAASPGACGSSRTRPAAAPGRVEVLVALGGQLFDQGRPGPPRRAPRAARARLAAGSRRPVPSAAARPRRRRSPSPRDRVGRARSSVRRPRAGGLGVGLTAGRRRRSRRRRPRRRRAPPAVPAGRRPTPRCLLGRGLLVELLGEASGWRS